MGGKELAGQAKTRKRGAELEQAIYDAVFEEVRDFGYAAFTLDAVAARAQTGKTSIYRRWQTKQDLVTDAFCARLSEPQQLFGDIPEDASTRDVLVAAGLNFVGVAADAGELMRAVACEADRDSERATLAEQVNAARTAYLVGILERGVVRGEVSPSNACGLFADLLPSALMYHVVLLNREVSNERVAEYVDRVIMPLIAAESRGHASFSPE